MSKKLLIIDLGHGGYDSGAVGNGRVEKVETRIDGQIARDYASKFYPDFDIRIFGEDVNKFVSVNWRMQETNRLTNQYGVNNTYFMSLHWNSASNPAAYGWEVWCNYPNTMGESMAKSISNEVNKVRGDLHNRGIRYSKGTKIGVVHTKPATVLVEACFIVNPKDIQRYDKVREKMIHAYIDGIAKYAGVRKVNSNNQDQSKPNDKPTVYRVCKSSFDGEQSGAYTVLENAKKRVDHLGNDWKVFNEKGEVVYPIKHWSDDYFKHLEESGIGFKDYRPNDNLTRGEFAAYMSRFIRKFDKGK